MAPSDWLIGRTCNLQPNKITVASACARYPTLRTHLLYKTMPTYKTIPKIDRMCTVQL